MTYSISFVEKEDYLHITITGKDTLNNSIKYWEEVFDTIRNSGAEKVLVEEKLIGDLSTIETYKVSKAIPEFAKGLKSKIAFFDSDPEHKSTNEFGETVTLTRGVEIKVFNSLTQAIKYLSDS